MKEIERKFLITTLPDVSKLKATSYERRWISLTDTTEIRLQKKWDQYQLQHKVQWESDFTNSKQTLPLTQEEFEQLKKSALHQYPLLRICYAYSNSIKISIYKWFLEELIRAEVEFESIEEANKYKPEDRMGKEITNEKEGRDRNLIEQ